MKNLKKVMALLLAGTLVLGSFAGCGDSGKDAGSQGQTEDQANIGDNGGSGDNGESGDAQEPAGGEQAPSVEVKNYKIGVAHYTDSGKGVEALKAYCEGISESTGCEFVFTTLSTYDEATNLTEIQNLISSGCDGIIMTADMGTTAIVKECEAAGVYLAGFLCDYLQSDMTAHEDVFGNEYFLGSVADGYLDPSPYGEQVAEAVIAGGYKNIGEITFPAFAYPKQADIMAAFNAKIEEYNATADEADKITTVDPIELNFAPLEDTYFSEHPDLDCIFSAAAGAGMVYPVMVANNKTDIKLYTTGFEGTDDTDNFGSAGNQCYQGIMCSSPEAIAYPLCLLIDKLNGTTYSDLPDTEVVACSPLVILSDEDMEAVVNNSIYYSADYSKALITGEDIVNMCASYNPDATYAGLVDAVNHLSVDDLK